MAKKKAKAEVPRIPLDEIEVGGTYRNYVKDLVKIQEIDLERNEIRLYNISGSHRMWVSAKHIYLTTRLD